MTINRKFLSASIAAGSGGNNTVIAAVAGSSIRVYGVHGVVTGTTPTLQWRDGASTNLTPDMTPISGAEYIMPFIGVPWMVTTAGNAFVLRLTGANAALAGRVIYTLD